MMLPFKSRNLLCAASVSMALCLPSLVSGDDAPDGVTAATIRELIAGLGANQYVVRESATTQLYELGQGAESAQVLSELNEASKTGDREVRMRARRLIGLLSQHLQDKRIAGFLDGGSIEGIPGWKRFSEIHGENATSRALFAEMLRVEWRLLETCLPVTGRANAATIRTATSERYDFMLQSGNRLEKVPLGTTMTYLFLSAEYPETTELQSRVFRVIPRSQQLTQKLRRAKLASTPQNDLVRQVFKRWLVETTKQNRRYEISVLGIALQFRLFDESIVIAELILKNQNSSPVNKSTSMQIITALRHKPGIALIEPFLTDERKLNTQSKQPQLRDVALTCLMDLNGHDVTKIGVVRTNDLLRPYQAATLGFASEEERKKAFALFEELQAEKAFQQRKQSTEDGDPPK